MSDARRLSSANTQPQEEPQTKRLAKLLAAAISVIVDSEVETNSRKLKDALAAVRAIPDDDEARLDETLATIRAIQDEHIQARALSSFARKLVEVEQGDEAVAAAQAIPAENRRIVALDAAAQPVLPEEFIKVLNDAAAKIGIDRDEALRRSIVLIAAILKAKEAGLKVGFTNDDNELVMEQYLRQLCRDRVSGYGMNTTNSNNLAENAFQ